MSKSIAAHACAFGLAFGLIAFGNAAWAASALATGKGLFQDRTDILLIMDEETRAVEEDLRPEEYSDNEGEGAPKEPMTEAAEGKDAGRDIEDKMIDEIGPGAE